MDHLLNNQSEIFRLSFGNNGGTETETKTSLGIFKCRRSRMNTGSKRYQLNEKELEVVEGSLDYYTTNNSPIKKGDYVLLEIGEYLVASDPHPHTGYDGSIHHIYCRLSRIV